MAQPSTTTSCRCCGRAGRNGPRQAEQAHKPSLAAGAWQQRRGREARAQEGEESDAEVLAAASHVDGCSSRPAVLL